MKKAIVFITACILFTSCFKKPKDMIVGKWKAAEGSFTNSVMIFNDNGGGRVQQGTDTADSQPFGYQLSDDGKQILVFPPDKVPATFKENRDLDQEMADIVKLDKDSFVVKQKDSYHRFSRLH